MKRPASALAAWVFLTTAILCVAQGPPDRQPCPDVTAEAEGCELIAWSHLQEPIPLPQATAPPHHETIAGIIVIKRQQAWLRVTADAAFLLDGGELTVGYEGRQVRIAGVVDRELKTLHVESIQPIQ